MLVILKQRLILTTVNIEQGLPDLSTPNLVTLNYRYLINIVRIMLPGPEGRIIHKVGYISKPVY